MHHATDAGWHPHRNSAPLVGRERELQLLRRQLDSVLVGHGGLALIGGEAGIGKSTLVQHFTETAGDSGALVLVGNCYDLTTTPPYGPWIEVTRNYRPDGDLPPLPDVLRPGTGMGTVANQADLFEVARSFLTSVAEARPLVVVLEDLHWSDPASLDLLRYLGRDLRGHRILVLATYRDDEITRRHLLFQLLPVLVRESEAERIALRPISQGDVGTLLEHNYALDEPDRSRLGSYLQRFGEGNPLYVREILRTLEDEGQLAEEGSGWTLGDLSGLQVPSLLMQLIERRLLKLDDTQRALLEVAAVVGQQVPVDLWAQSSAASRSDISATAERAIAANVLQEQPGGTSLAFGHALVREALYQGIPLPRRQVLHVGVAEALLELSDPDPDAVAYHFSRAGDDRAIDWLVRAGERAQRTYAWKTAAQRFAEASGLLQGHESRLRERGWLMYRTARLLRFSDHTRAIHLMDEAELIGKRVNDPALTAYATTDRGQIRLDDGDYRRGLDDTQRGNELLDALPIEYRTSPEIRSWVADVARSANGFPGAISNQVATAMSINVRRGLLIMEISAVGRHREATAVGEPYIEMIESLPVLDHSVRSTYSDASTGLAVAYSALGRVEQARRSFQNGYETRKAIAHHVPAAVTAMFYLSCVHLPYSTDDLEERERFDAAMHEIMAHAEGAVASFTANSISNFELLWVEARWDDIRASGPEGLNHIATYQRYNASLAIARVEHASGNPLQAWNYIDPILPSDWNSEPGDRPFTFALHSQSLAAHLAMDAGDLATAKHWIESHDRWLHWSEATRWHSDSSLLWARFNRLSGDSGKSLEMAKAALEQAMKPRQPLSLVAAHRLLGELKIEEREFDRAEEHLNESLALADACAAPFERALTLLSLAELHTATGEPAEARNLLSEVVTICEPIGARPALERAESFAARLDKRPPRQKHPAGLTKREVEVLRLISRGMTDREIAEELFISHHTVMRHVSHILAKLGVESRAGAAATAVRIGIE